MSEKGQVFINSLKSFLSPIADLLDDDSITEIMINGPSNIWVETGGKVKKSDSQFPDEDSLRAAVNNIAQSVGRRINDEKPRLDARLPNGYRIHAVIPPCARNGTTVAIRKFFKKKMTLKDYVRNGSLTLDAAHFLDLSMKLGKNILVSGGTGSGKTTLLSVLCSRVPAGQRILVIEDSSELSMDYEHCVFFESRVADEQGEGAVSIKDLLHSSLRLRPDRIVVGEVRGSEAEELIQAMSTGHKGCLGTVHANSAAASLIRLETLVPDAKTLRQQIPWAIDLIVQVSRFADGSRRVASIDEVKEELRPCGGYDVVPIYKMGRLVRQPDGHLKGQLEPTGILPSFMEEIEDNNIPFPREKFKAVA